LSCRKMCTVWASSMTAMPGDPAGTSVADVGVDFGRELRARGNVGKGRPADKAFRDSLFDDS